MASEGQTVEVSNQPGPRCGVVFLARPSSSVQALQRRIYVFCEKITGFLAAAKLCKLGDAFEAAKFWRTWIAAVVMAQTPQLFLRM